MNPKQRKAASSALVDAVARLKGQQLSSVEFVQDYVQLKFDGPYLSAYTPPVVEIGGRKAAPLTPGYRDDICARIGRLVLSLEFREQERLTLHFDDGASMSISLRDEDYIGPEALQFVDGKERWVV